MALTEKRKQFYESLLGFFRRHLRMPTHREAAKLNGLKSANSSVQYHQALADEGLLQKDENGNYIFSSAVDVWPGGNGDGSVIPVLGEITAGTMQEAVESDLGELTFDYLFPNVEDVYA
ncbi:MAG: hypothetical protein R3281_13635, partial [Balneolaceae bacterium]|nr:hypothetical protein [Balneolaceae bacterium]